MPDLENESDAQLLWRVGHDAGQNQRRSIAMLPSGVPALNRHEALELLGQLEAALVELRKLRAPGEVR